VRAGGATPGNRLRKSSHICGLRHMSTHVAVELTPNPRAYRWFVPGASVPLPTRAPLPATNAGGSTRPRLPHSFFEHRLQPFLVGH
jgi:hypothetical protein